MLFITFQLGTHASAVRVFEFAPDHLLIKARIECAAAALPRPQSVDDAIQYFRGTAFHIEQFEDMDEAQSWALSYRGFRADEVRAELDRYAVRVAAVDRLAA